MPPEVQSLKWSTICGTHVQAILDQTKGMATFTQLVKGCKGLYWAVLSCTELYWAVPGCSVRWWVVLGCTRRYCALMGVGCAGQSWAVLGSARLRSVALGCTGLGVERESLRLSYGRPKLTLTSSVAEMWNSSVSHLHRPPVTFWKV